MHRRSPDAINPVQHHGFRSRNPDLSFGESTVFEGLSRQQKSHTTFCNGSTLNQTAAPITSIPQGEKECAKLIDDG
jgi:hypothetical protein